MGYQITYDGNIGGVPIPSTDYTGSVTIASGNSITGNYSILLSDTTEAHFRFLTSTSTPAISLWIYITEYAWENDNACKIEFHTSSGELVGLWFNATNKTFDLYINESKVADGTVCLDQQALFNVRMYGTIADSGSITVKIGGLTSISYSGDTKPGTSALVDYVRIYTYKTQVWNHTYVYISSLSLNDGGADPGDRRAVVLMPNGDSSVQMTPSTGTSNYAVVDDIPLDDADYVEGDTNGEKDLYNLEDFEGTDRTITGITAFARAWKTTADTQALKVGVKSNTTEDSTQHDLETEAKYYFHSMENNPDDSAAWEDADVDALLALLEVVI